MIQCESSQFFCGSRRVPKVVPACNSTVSPQDALERTREGSSPARTDRVRPGAGVAPRELSTEILGSSAGAPNSPDCGDDRGDARAGDPHGLGRDNKSSREVGVTAFLEKTLI